MYQLKTFRGKDLTQVENSANYWLSKQGDNVEVIQTEVKGFNDTHMIVITYKTKPSILHG